MVLGPSRYNVSTSFASGDGLVAEFHGFHATLSWIVALRSETALHSLEILSAVSLSRTFGGSFVLPEP
jgi:hypothetical protein